MGRRLNNSSGAGSGTPRKITGATTETYLQSGQVVQLTGAAPYTVILPNPASFVAVNSYYWNNTGGDVTVQTPSGFFKGPSGNDTNTVVIEDGFTLGVQSDGTNYYAVWENLPDKTGSDGTVLTSDGYTGGLYWGSTNIATNNDLGTYNKNSSINIDLVSEGYATSASSAPLTFTALETLPIGLSLTSAGVLSGSLSTATESSYTIPIQVDDGSGIKKINFVLGVSLTNSVPTWSTATNLGSATISSGTSISLQVTATVGSGAITYSLVSGSLPGGTTLNANTGAITGNSSDTPDQTYNYNFTIRATANTFSVDRTFTYQLTITPPIGQQLYTGSNSSTNGGEDTYTWTAPSGVTSVGVAAIGAGSGGRYDWAACGGAGGGLAWANGIPVTPGQNYTIKVGRGGCWSGNGGGYSCFPGVIGGGGRCGCCPGCCVVTASINGNAGGGCGTVAYPNTAGGGGGGAGYGPNQGNTANSGYSGCYGGGGSATSHHSSTYGTGGGGGTGIYGQGANGACGNPGYSHQTGSGGQGGSGGTCGRPGEPWSNGRGNGYSCGGCFGGGGGGGGTSHGGGWGGKGAVRIIWGPNREWPSTGTADQ